MAAFKRAMAPFCATVQQPTCVITDQRPNGATNYARIDATPEVLAGVLALLGLAVLGQFAMSSARRRRRDFAILKTLGLLRRQLAAITAWQVTALTALALLVGLPLGVAAGHWAWALFADEVGLSTGAITPVPWCSHAARGHPRGDRHHVPGRAAQRPPEPGGRPALGVSAAA